MSEETTRVLSKMDNLMDMKIDQTPTQGLLAGEVRLKIDRFALTTNNISYAAFGESIGYWKVFPTNHSGFGHMPVWGYAQIIESSVEQCPVGARLWGYYPMASQLIVRPGKITKYSFVDTFEHRRAVPAIYNRYTFCDTNPFYKPQNEALECIFRPLFITSYTAVEFLNDNDFFSAKSILISCASSKTAYGIAWCLREKGLPVIGLTSERNVGFVRGLGVYDHVLSYAELQTLENESPTLYIDLANDDDLRSRVSGHFGGLLRYQCLVGSTRANSLPSDVTQPGPAPVFFFAAEYLDSQRETGLIRNFLNRFEADQVAFFKYIRESDKALIQITQSAGLPTAKNVVLDLLAGRSDPSRGHVICLEQ